MQLSVKGRHLDIGDAFRLHVDESLTAIFGKYFGDAIEASVTLSREAHLYRSAISVHIGRGIQAQAAGEAPEIHAAFDTAAAHLSKRLRRYKRRIRDHNSKSLQSSTDGLLAQQYILAADNEETGEDQPGDSDQPVVVAEMETEIPSLTVSEAVMRMDLADAPAMMFRNRAHGGLNMLYRRSDGNIGWIDPRGNRGS